MLNSLVEEALIGLFLMIYFCEQWEDCKGYCNRNLYFPKNFNSTNL